MRKIILRFLLLPTIGLLVLSLSFLGYQGASAFMSANSYWKQIQATTDIAELNQSAQSLSNKTSALMKTLNLPGLRQLLQSSDLDFSNIINEISTSIAITPTLLGAASPKRYLIVFQNSAEARGTGGIIGAFAIIELNKGKLSVIQTGSNAALQPLPTLPFIPTPEYKNLYGNDPAIWQNSNMSPHFPYGAKMYMALWKNQTGKKLDGVFAVDPSALSYLLQATGDITLATGEVISARNLVSNTLSTAYKTYEKDNNARKQYLVDIMNATFTKINAGAFNKLAMARGLQRAIIERRILVYTTEKSAAAKLAKTRLGGALEKLPDNQYSVVVQNIDASKLDYYLARRIKISATECSDPRLTALDIKVTNTVDKKAAVDLPAYVLTRADGDKPSKIVPGQHRIKLFVYGPYKASIESAARSNRKVPPGRATSERGRPLAIFEMDLVPGESEDLRVNFAGGTGKLTYRDPPLVIPTRVTIKDNC